MQAIVICTLSLCLRFSLFRSYIIRVGPRCYHRYPSQRKLRRRFDVQKRGACPEGAGRDLKILAFKIGMLWPQAKECQQLPRSWKKQRVDSPREPQEGERPCQHLDFTQVRRLWTSGPQDCETINFSCFKLPGLWQSVRVTTGNEQIVSINVLVFIQYNTH